MFENIKNTFLSKNEVANAGFCNGLPYVIKDYGSHYCAYVGIPKTHPLYGKSEFDEEICDIEVNGGMTYAEGTDRYWVFGWDYCHLHNFENGVKINEIFLDIQNATKYLSQQYEIKNNLTPLLTTMKNIYNV